MNQPQHPGSVEAEMSDYEALRERALLRLKYGASRAAARDPEGECPAPAYCSRAERAVWDEQVKKTQDTIRAMKGSQNND